MRLVHTTTLKLHEFPPKGIPPYAILSHTWGCDEVTFQDMMNSCPPSTKLGYNKIICCSEQARGAGLEYVWIDTCCIDKKSSVELSEAINSMFQWYRQAAVCYVYLNDMHITTPAFEVYSQLLGSRWFKRGWTLQELIASDLRVVFSSTWVKIGLSSKERLELPKFRIKESFYAQIPDITQHLCHITGIPIDILQGDSLEQTSIAQRMSWAAYRETTRVEDEAYCLLGIFDVNMPLLYGEGRRAFLRLQEEILKSSDDQSILAHISPTLEAPVGLLAQSPAFFALAGDIGKSDRSWTTSEDAVALTKQGLKIYSTICPLSSGSACLAILDCTVGRSSVARPAIYLERQEGSKDCYQRYSHRFLLILSPQRPGLGCHMIWRPTMLDISINALLEQINFDQAYKKTIHIPFKCADNTLIRLPTVRVEEIDKRLVLLSVEPKNSWDHDTKTVQLSSGVRTSEGTQAVFHIQDKGSGLNLDLLVGFDPKEFDEEKSRIWAAWCLLIPLGADRISHRQPKSTNTLSEARKNNICSDSLSLRQTKAQQSVVDLGCSFQYLVQASIEAIKFLGRQEVILQVRLLSKPKPQETC
ncbi:hypothetical protein VE01_10779 [Pseudogymnoascus verrucosus]|uniref:Heterokaryon incompatibility domain-containing protein n=1 Tax=Pseudogymnoascus verrucosus TaxID=342668 RepID=A0A2P6FGW3_9PEZI|nr:uncharacterized protein VE01_10779 [Pseudogymnoascus verrucosus]PQM43883.1 hypothetical protein VE01_10779 [Pseudogymnoascus verrucosus]